jgi:uncharacterized protein (TIGR00369 family)
VRFPPPVAELIGIELLEQGGGRSMMRLEAGEQHSNPMGTIHSGILCDLADAAMGVAFFSTLDEDESFTTLELKINYVRPFWTGTLIAYGRVIHRGKSVGLTDCRVVDDEDRLVAHATSTCMALRGAAAVGR